MTRLQRWRAVVNERIKLMKRYLPILATCIAAGFIAIAALAAKTQQDLLPLPQTLSLADETVAKVQALDRYGTPLTITYQNRWNMHAALPLHRIPALLQDVFVAAEDQRFFRHHGVDWTARLRAVIQNLGAGRVVRGASTITEQVVRMWHPRPRTLWSRWLEGLEAAQLEKRFSKAAILEFYLNQVPYAAQRRGVSQAAGYYFDRDLDTLNVAEILSLAVLVRAPGRFDLWRDSTTIQGSLYRLAERLHRSGTLEAGALERVHSHELVLHKPGPPIQASHFVRHLENVLHAAQREIPRQVYSTLDGELQQRVQQILDQRLAGLQARKVTNGAVLVQNHATGDLLAWVNGSPAAHQTPAGWFDAVTTPRQPGSTLKPFLYALALENGWTAATLVDDRPLAMPVGSGLHAYHNYSRVHYGPLRLRETLGNSLNIPAVRAVQHVGVEPFLNRLHQLGFASLEQHPHFYGEGLALGNGEVTLLELVQAYSALANRGIRRPAKLLLHDNGPESGPLRVFTAEVSSLIADILSDAQARQREFGSGSLLRLPVQTAVKTGTSNDYRDAWAVGFNDRFTVGVWMGNLDGSETDGVTGAIGPALVLRSVFAELNRHRPTRSLYLSPKLIRRQICRRSGLPADGRCLSMYEWFVPGTEPDHIPDEPHRAGRPIRFVQPTPGLHLALDPRLPDHLEVIEFQLSALPEKARAEWYVDGRFIAGTRVPHAKWILSRGAHTVYALIRVQDPSTVQTVGPVGFVVK